MTTDVLTQGGDGTPFLAVDVQADLDANSIVLDVSELDGYDLLAWGNDPGWVNVVCDVSRVSIVRGSTRQQGVLTRAEAASVVVDLSDTQRRFDPLANADAVHTGTPLRLRAWGYGTDGQRWEAVLFTGTIDAIPVSYPKDAPPQVSISATDLIGDLARWKGPGRPDPGVGQGDNLRGRAVRILAEAGKPATLVSAASDTVFAATLAPSALAAPWADLAAATDAELGRVWVDAANVLVLRARESALAGTVRGTLSDLHGEEVGGAPHCCILDNGLEAALGPENLTNRAIASRRVLAGSPPAAVVQLDDMISQARYGTFVTDQRGLELDTDAQLGPWTQSLVLTDGRPRLRIDSVTPRPSPADVESAVRAWPAVCATDLGDRWIVRYRPAEGPMVAKALGVLGIAWTITPQDWSVTWTTEDAPEPLDLNPSGWVTLDLSELDGPDLLTSFDVAGPVLTYDTARSVYGATDSNLTAERTALAAGTLKVLCVGDSITAGVPAVTAAQTWPALLPTKLAAMGYSGAGTKNVGISGSTTGQWLSASLPADQVAYAPTLTTIALGTNDAVQNVTVSTYAANLTALVRRYQALGQVLLIAPIPNQSVDVTAYEQATYKVAADTGVPVLDMFRRWGSWAAANTAGWMAESTHPNASGYDAYATAVADALAP